LLANMVPITVLVCGSRLRRWKLVSTTYFSEFCGKYAVKRKAVGIWGCKDRDKVKAVGAYKLMLVSLTV